MASRLQGAEGIGPLRQDEPLGRVPTETSTASNATWQFSYLPTCTSTQTSQPAQPTASRSPSRELRRRAHLARFGVAGGAAPAELGGVGGEGDWRCLEALLVQLLVGRAETVLAVQPLL